MIQRTAIAVAALFMVASTVAQIHGVPAGATSVGGNRSMGNPPGIPASATALGPRGFSQQRFQLPVPPFDRRDHDGDGDRDGDRVRRIFIPVTVPLYGYSAYPYLYPYPYSPGPVISPADYHADVAPVPVSAMMPAPIVVQPIQQPPQVIVIDNRGVRDATDEEKEAAIATSNAAKKAKLETKPEPKLEPDDVGPMTVLVFRDGTRKEVKNYAIMGKELIELGSGSLRRHLLADIDVPATQKENDVRGLDFKLP